MVWNTVLTRQFPHKFENKDNIFRVEVASDLYYEFLLFLCCSDSDTTKTWALGSVTLWFFSGCFERLGIFIKRYIYNHHFLCVWSGYRFSFNNISRFIMYSNFFTIMCLYSELLFTCGISVFVQKSIIILIG